MDTLRPIAPVPPLPPPEPDGKRERPPPRRRPEPPPRTGEERSEGERGRPHVDEYA